VEKTPCPLFLCAVIAGCFALLCSLSLLFLLRRLHENCA
jgi:hypothetical protein